MAGLLSLYQMSDGYCYNTDSIVLASFAQDFLKRGESLLDVGCGCGILGLLCARERELKLTLLEIENLAFCLAKLNAQNAQNRGLICDFEAKNCDIFDFFLKDGDTKFDNIILNPPFYNANIIKSPNQRICTARVQSFMPLERLFKHLKSLIKPRGNLIFCYDARECAKVFFELKNSGFNAKIMRFVHPLASKNATLLLVCAKIDYKGDVQILSPLFTHNSPNQMDNTDELKGIYKWARTLSIKVASEHINCKEIE